MYKPSLKTKNTMSAQVLKITHKLASSLNPFKLTVMILLLQILTACQNHKAINSKQEKSWTLDKEQSSISLISTKNNRIAEIFNFKNFKGSIDKNAYFSIEIDLNSIETNIPIRNQRMQKHLFETNIFPTANIHTQLNIEDLTAGIHKIQFDVDMHGVSEIVQAEFMVFDKLDSKIITLHKPLIINAKDYGLENGIQALKNIAKLQSIDFTVPVNIVLTFKIDD